MFCPFVFWDICKVMPETAVREKEDRNLKKKILTAVLAGVLLGGIAAGADIVQAKEIHLTMNCEAAEAKEKSVIKKLLPEYAKATGILIEPVSEDADIVLGDFGDMEEKYKKGQLCNLYPFMQKESPYSEAASWEEALPGEIRDRLQIYKREIPGYPASRSVVRMFCNKDLFEKAGMEIPDTWSELISISGELLEQGISPLLLPGKDSESPVWQWLVNYLCSQMNANLADSLDETEDRYVELAEACKGTDKGSIDYTQPEMQAALQCLKEFYDLSTGKNLSYEETLETFAQGETAMIFASSEDACALEGGFSKKAVSLPRVTEETSAYASGAEILAGGEAMCFYGINAGLTEEKEKLKSAVDFLQYMTSETVQERMAFEAGRLPSVKDVRLPEEMEDFRVSEEPLRMSYFTGLDGANKKELWGYIRSYLDEEIEIAALTEKMNKSCQEAAKRIREENSWTLVNNYGMPTIGECTKCEP